MKNSKSKTHFPRKTLVLLIVFIVSLGIIGSGIPIAIRAYKQNKDHQTQQQLETLQKLSELSNQVDALKDENSKLKNQITPTPTPKTTQQSQTTICQRELDPTKVEAFREYAFAGGSSVEDIERFVTMQKIIMREKYKDCLAGKTPSPKINVDVNVTNNLR